MKLLTVLALAVSALALNSPPSGALIVKKSPSSGQYGTIQAAINALSTTSTAAQTVFIYSGTYNEQVLIPARKASLTLYGQTTDQTTYKSNTVTISYNKDANSAGGDDPSGTVRNQASNTKMYNLNITNTFGAGAQAIALSAYGSRQGYYGIALTGYQDTLLSQTGTQVYGRSLIQGRTDFIFGQHAQSWIAKSDIRVLAGGTGYITASGRASSSDTSWYVLDQCSVGTAQGQNVAQGAYYLGRPWGEYARVVVQKSVLSGVVNAAGWSIWNAGDERTGHVVFEEFGNTGAGAAGTRAGFSKMIGAAVTIGSVLGSDYGGWVDAAFV